MCMMLKAILHVFCRDRFRKKKKKKKKESSQSLLWVRAMVLGMDFINGIHKKISSQIRKTPVQEFRYYFPMNFCGIALK